VINDIVLVLVFKHFLHVNEIHSNKDLMVKYEKKKLET